MCERNTLVNWAIFIGRYFSSVTITKWCLQRKDLCLRDNEGGPGFKKQGMISLEGSNRNNKILLFSGQINVTDVLYWQEGSWQKILSYFDLCIERRGCQEIKERKHSLSYIMIIQKECWPCWPDLIKLGSKVKKEMLDHIYVDFYPWHN